MDPSAFVLALTPALLLAIGVLRRRTGRAMETFALSYAGFWYVAVLLSFLVRLAFEWPVIEEGRTNYTGRIMLLVFIVLVKMSDIGAYTFGRIWGKRKLIPAISPAKTVEGLVGGYVFSLAAGLASADAAYSVKVSTGTAENLALGDALGSGFGVYEGWGFTLEDSTLKFKNLA